MFKNIIHNIERKGLFTWVCLRIFFNLDAFLENQALWKMQATSSFDTAKENKVKLLSCYSYILSPITEIVMCPAKPI